MYRKQLLRVLDITCKDCHGYGSHVVLNFAAWHEDLVTWVANCGWLPLPHGWQRLHHAVTNMQASGGLQEGKAVQHARQCDEKLDL